MYDIFILNEPHFQAHLEWCFSASFVFEIDIPVSCFINLLVLFISLKSIIITYLQNSINPLPSICSPYLFQLPSLFGFALS